MKRADLEALILAGTVLSNVVYNLGQKPVALSALRTTGDKATEWVKAWDLAVRRARLASKRAAPSKKARSGKRKRRG